MRTLISSDNFFQDPFHMLDDLQREFQQISKRIHQPIPGEDYTLVNRNIPFAHWQEKENFFLLELEIPGTKAEDIDLSISNKTLKISGEKRKGTEYHESFMRRFRLDQDINEEEIQANYENGILQVALPKAVKTKARKISIPSKEQSSFWSKFLGSSHKKESIDINAEKH